MSRVNSGWKEGMEGELDAPNRWGLGQFTQENRRDAACPKLPQEFTGSQQEREAGILSFQLAIVPWPLGSLNFARGRVGTLSPAAEAQA